MKVSKPGEAEAEGGRRRTGPEVIGLDAGLAGAVVCDGQRGLDVLAEDLLASVVDQGDPTV